jgi:transcriptional regulator with XRE-family HTH domain
MVDSMEVVSMKLSEARARKLLSLRALAAKSGVSESNIYRLERGDWLPSLRTARKLADALEMAPEDIDEIRAAIEKAGRGKEAPARAA